MHVRASALAVAGPMTMETECAALAAGGAAVQAGVYTSWCQQIEMQHILVYERTM